jgi:hypothetical protein
MHLRSLRRGEDFRGGGILPSAMYQLIYQFLEVSIRRVQAGHLQ